MTVVDLRREKPHLARIFLSNGSDFAIDLDLACETPVKKGSELSEADVSRLIESSDELRAKSRALWYLDRGDRTEKELYTKLIKAGFNKTACEKVLIRLNELGLTDDRRYALRFCETAASKGLSRRAISEKLYLKGIPKDIISDTLSELEVDEDEQIKALIQKKYARILGDGSDAKQIEKVYAALIRRGFSFSCVRNALKSYSEELKSINGEDFDV